jgi:hypothetical protein
MPLFKELNFSRNALFILEIFGHSFQVACKQDTVSWHSVMFVTHAKLTVTSPSKRNNIDSQDVLKFYAFYLFFMHRYVTYGLEMVAFNRRTNTN